MYTVQDQKILEFQMLFEKIIFNIGINGVEIPFERTVVYKYKCKREMYNYLILFLR
jgi:hypothetical protein